MSDAIGYIGLGAMGAPMLRRLAGNEGGAPTFGYDAAADVTTSVCADTGATACASVADIAARVDVLCTCLPNDQVLSDVYLGNGGILSTIRPGSITIDFSTVSPAATNLVHDRLREAGISHLDASMLGSVKQATEGTISFVVGGDAEALKRVYQYLELMGGLIRHCGPSGSGNRVKLVHQTLVAGHAVAVGEALALCQRTGVDIDLFYDIVANGTGFAGSRYFEQRVPRMTSGDFSPLFALRLMAKDARLARAMVADDDEARLPALDAVVAALEEGEAMGIADEDFSAVLKVAEARLAVGDRR